MSESKRNTPPYKNLGFRLKRLRESLNESLVEVSGAVEIDPEILTLFESGQKRPSEDILLLLISHFDPQEEEALRLWELAGYDQNQMNNSDDANAKPIVMLLQPDSRIMYSDMVNVVSSNQGLVMNFLQAQGEGRPTPIARVGMSHQQALRVFEALGQTLQRAQLPPKSLPAPKPVNDSSDQPSV